MKTLSLYCVILMTASHVAGQVYNSADKYDINKLRLLIQTAGLYLYAANQGQIDLDSAMFLSSSAQKVTVSLSYDEGYNDGTAYPGSNFIDKGDIQSAKVLLAKLKGLDRLRLLLQLGGYYLFKPGSYVNDLKAASLYIQQSLALSDSLNIAKWQNQCLTLLAKYYLQAGDLEKSNESFSRLVMGCKKSADESAIAYALDNQGTFIVDNDSLKVVILSQAMALYKKLNKKEKEIETLMKIISVHFREGKMDLVNGELQQSLYLQIGAGFKHTHYTLTTLAYAEMLKGNMNKALSYALESIKTMEATGDTALSDHFYIMLANVYNITGRNDEVLALYKKNIDEGLRITKKPVWYKHFLITVEALAEAGRFAEALSFIDKLTNTYPPGNTLDNMLLAQVTGVCYERLGRQNEAEKNYIKMAAFASQLKSLETMPHVSSCYSTLALFFSKQGYVDKAKYYSRKVRETRSGRKDVYTDRSLELALFKIDSLTGNYLSSIAHYQQYKSLNDSLFNISKNRQLQELQIRYETSKKEQNIQLLENQSKLQQSNLYRGRVVTNFILAGIVLSLGFTGLLYNRNRLKQKINRQLEKLINEKEDLLEEKDWLVKEIHHRVKNNLQIVISLMNIQSAYLENGAALDAIRESQSRMNAMSLIHQKLYQSPSVVSINMSTYINELITHLKASFGEGQKIQCNINVAPIELDVTQAVPIGLILNEAVTNSMKYAFPAGAQGVITISFSHGENNDLLLSIADNGVGLPAGFNFKKSGSIGITLIETLTDQLSGNLSLKNENGVKIEIAFANEVIASTNKRTFSMS